MTLFELGSLSLSVAKPTSRNKPQTKCQKADADPLAVENNVGLPSSIN
jgi:hypothetical protein